MQGWATALSSKRDYSVLEGRGTMGKCTCTFCTISQEFDSLYRREWEHSTSRILGEGKQKLDMRRRLKKSEISLRFLNCNTTKPVGDISCKLYFHHRGTPKTP
jgi:hypothetical protein